MKRKLLFLFFAEFLFLSAKAYEVPTEIRKKSILLEEFTGIHCIYCPQGHTIADNLLTAQPDVAYTIAIHSGNFAVPNYDEPDFRIEEGEAIDSEFAIPGYPAGFINRGASVLNRGEWIKAAKLKHEEDAPVNLWLKSVFDGNNRELKVYVEGYYTGETEESFHYLNVVLTQNNIKGPQTGGLVGDNYNHRHMLRAFITPLWGDIIEEPQQGEYFTREYTYVLPANVKNVELDVENIEIIAFVCADKRDVLNVIGAAPEYINYEKPLGAVIQKPKFAMPAQYGFNFFEILLKNESSETITTANFQVSINDEIFDAEWTGNIPAFSTKPIIIEILPYTIKNNNEYKIQLISLNNIDANSIINGSFSKPVESTSKISLEIQTDLYADENVFSIKDRDGVVIETFGPYPADINDIYHETIELERDKIYCFEILDSWGDGMQKPSGYYKIFNDDETLIIQNSAIEKFGQRVFFKTSMPQSSISEAKKSKTNIFIDRVAKTIEIKFGQFNAAEAEISIQSITGQNIFTKKIKVSGDFGHTIIPVHFLQNGIYILSINQNKNRETFKFFIN